MALVAFPLQSARYPPDYGEETVVLPQRNVQHDKIERLLVIVDRYLALGTKLFEQDQGRLTDATLSD